MNAQILLLLVSVIGGCASASRVPGPPLAETTQVTSPVVFMPGLAPVEMLVHGGCYSPDLSEFMFTVSDAEFQRFDVKTIRRVGSGWSKPEDAFFNSSANEHGTSYSPDGQTLYFSSTRPVQHSGVIPTWHLWRCQREEDGWGVPTYVDLPNMRDRLASHASVAADGTLYFHAGAPDYSELHIYSAQPNGTQYGVATRLPARINQGTQQYTPFIDPEHRFLIYKNKSGLMISFRTKDGTWSRAASLGENAPTKSRGNPYVTPDGRFLLFAAGNGPTSAVHDPWTLYRISTAGLIPTSPGATRGSVPPQGNH